MTVVCRDFEAFLKDVDEPIGAVITSPPYAGLPGRSGRASAYVFGTLDAVKHKLDGAGSIVIVVGRSAGAPDEPYILASTIPHLEGWQVAGVYAWDRGATGARQVGRQSVTHDYVLHVTREGFDPRPLWESSVIRVAAEGFNYGFGVTLPPKLASLLVHNSTIGDELVVDPFAGLGEVGVQAVHQGRRFLGSDIDEACVRIANARIEGTPRA